MTADLTRDQAREQVARAIHDVQCVGRCEWDGAVDPWHPMRLRLADAALTVLWPVVESLRAERDEARENAEDDERLIRRQGDLLTGVANALRGDPPPLVAWGHSALPDLAFRVKVSMEEARAEVDRLTADLAHAHTVIARHVEPLRKPCRPEAGDCCDGDAHTWQPAQGSRLPDRVDGNTPSDALCGDLSHQAPGSGVSGRDDRTEAAR